jgi:hypothetical protein
MMQLIRIGLQANKKKEIAMIRKRWLVLGLNLLLIAAFVPIKSFTAIHVTRRPARKTTVLTRLPAHAVTVTFAQKNYYLHNGVYYRPGPRGYVLVAAPAGLPVAVLPVGYTLVISNGKPYYYYAGTWYRFDHVRRVYIVIENPVPEKTVQPADSLDRVVLLDGSEISGTYAGGDRETVRFEVDGELREIPVAGIATMEVAGNDE